MNILLRIKTDLSISGTIDNKKINVHILLRKLLPFLLPYWRRGVLASSLLIGASLLSLIVLPFFFLPDILIFDEPTSALDALTESAIKNFVTF